MQKCLIAGFGSVGRRHFKNLRTLGVKDFVLYRTQLGTLDDEAASEQPVTSDLKSALAQRPTMAVIANPTSLHLGTAVSCAEADCHLFIEKPVGDTLDQCGNLRTLVASRGLAAMVGFQFRYHPGLRQLKQLLEEGGIGRIASVEVHWGEYLPDWHPWEDYRRSYSALSDLGGGVILTLCHPFDYLRWLLGEVVEVSAMATNSGCLEISVEDTADVHLRFASGVIGHVHLNYIQRPSVHTLQVIGQCGTLRWDNSDGSVRCYRAETQAWKEYPTPAGFARNDLFVAEMRDFLDCLDASKEPACTLDDGIEALRIALAAKQSAHDRKPVTL